MPKSAQPTTLEAAMAIVEKKFGRGKVIWGDKFGDLKTERIPSGSIALDIALGGGLAVGYSHQFWGDESSGKTTNAFRSVASFQRYFKDKVAIWIATEPFDRNNAKANGIDLKKLVLVFPEYGEEALDIAAILVDTKQASVMVVDSVDSLIPRREYEGSMEDGMRSESPRMLNRALRKLASAMQPVEDDEGRLKYSSGLTVIWISQMRINQGLMFGNPETSSGGKGFKHAQSIRIQFGSQSKTKTIWDDSQASDKKIPVGLKMTCETIKNKTYPPFQTGDWNYYYSYHKIIKFRTAREFVHGMVDHARELVELAVAKGVLKSKGDSYILKKKKFRKHMLYAYIDERPKVTARLIRKLCAKVIPKIDSKRMSEYYSKLLENKPKRIKAWKDIQNAVHSHRSRTRKK